MASCQVLSKWQAIIITKLDTPAKQRERDASIGYQSELPATNMVRWIWKCRRLKDISTRPEKTSNKRPQWPSGTIEAPKCRRVRSLRWIHTQSSSTNEIGSYPENRSKIIYATTKTTISISIQLLRCFLPRHSSYGQVKWIWPTKNSLS